MDAASLPRSASENDGCIGWTSAFSSPALESDFRRWRLRDDLWIDCFLVVAAMVRVALLPLADYQHFGLGDAFWSLLAGRLAFIAISAWTFVALRRASSAASADRLFFTWACLIAAFTVFSLSARSPEHTGLLLMSFGVVLVAYCVTPLPLARQAPLALGYSAAALFVARQVDGATLIAVAATHGMAHVFGAVVSWQLNRRRREAFLAGRREAELRGRLEAAMAEIRTLRGLLCVCAWCKRIRDEAEAWQTMETYVQAHTHASFTHGICPDCLQTQKAKTARLLR